VRQASELVIVALHIIGGEIQVPAVVGGYRKRALRETKSTAFSGVVVSIAPGH
jgi:hypothetical protein